MVGVTGKALVIRGDALKLPLPDESVDLIVTSPPFWALRSYRDGGEHYDGQLGSEAQWPMFLDNLMVVMREAVRVLKPTGSIFVELGDKYAGSGGHNNAGVSKHGDKRGPSRYNQNNGSIPAKSLMMLPERFRIRCVDELGLIARAVIVWSRLNGLPESVTDRVRRSHTEMVHFTKEGRYFAAVDEVREPHLHNGDGLTWDERKANGQAMRHGDTAGGANLGAPGPKAGHSLGKVPGSVWALPSEPLIISDEVKAHYDLPDHFAAFPTELVRRVILGWSPSGVCTVCNEGRRPVVAKEYLSVGDKFAGGTAIAGRHQSGQRMGDGINATITGYACPCGLPAPPTRPSVVLDVFGGTGTTAGVARALGRTGISVDLSHDYSRLARWRIERSGHFAKVNQRTHRENQGSLL